MPPYWAYRPLDEQILSEAVMRAVQQIRAGQATMPDQRRTLERHIATG